MSTLAIVVLVVVAIIVLLAVGGAIARRRQLDRNTGAFEAELEQVNADLAQARAEDRGWERESLEAAAREAFERERPGQPAPALTLVRIVDRPGTDDDKAVFRLGHMIDGELMTLGRQNGAWVLEAIE
ncbi:MAG TPA: hypothetical protein VF533_02785 [Solirubrobacteraceae bacterium]